MGHCSPHQTIDGTFIDFFYQFRVKLTSQATFQFLFNIIEKKNRMD